MSLSIFPAGVSVVWVVTLVTQPGGKVVAQQRRKVANSALDLAGLVIGPRTYREMTLAEIKVAAGCGDGGARWLKSNFPVDTLVPLWNGDPFYKPLPLAELLARRQAA
jgi:hypothetical protein